MPCPYRREDLSAYIDGETDDRVRQRIRKHLRECRQCQREVAWLTTVAQMVRALPRSEPRRAPAWQADRLAARAPKPLHCTVALPAASAYIDGELPEDDAAAVLAHVSTCDACYGVYKELEQVTEALGATEPLPAPAGLQQRIVQAVAADNTRRSRALRWVCIAGQCAAPGLRCTARLAAAAVFLLALGYAVWYAVTPPAQSPSRPGPVAPIASVSQPADRPLALPEMAIPAVPSAEQQAGPPPTRLAVRAADVISAVAAATGRAHRGVDAQQPGATPPPTTPTPAGGSPPPTVVAPPGPRTPGVPAGPAPQVSPSPSSMVALAHPAGRAGEPGAPGRGPGTSLPEPQLVKRTPSEAPLQPPPPTMAEPTRVADLPPHEEPAASEEIELRAPRNTGWTPVYRPSRGMDPESLHAAARRIGATLEAAKHAQPPTLPIHP